MGDDKNTKNTEFERDKQDFADFFGELSGESDRAIATLGAAKLDYILQQILSNCLLPDTSGDDDLLGDNAPLNSFSAKIRMTRRLGLVDEYFARALHQVRKIRNIFAHEVRGGSLDSPIHRDRIEQLVAPMKNDSLFLEVREHMHSVLEPGPKADFVEMVSIMFLRLRGLLTDVEPIKVNTVARLRSVQYSRTQTKKPKSRRASP